MYRKNINKGDKSTGTGFTCSSESFEGMCELMGRFCKDKSWISNCCTMMEKVKKEKDGKTNGEHIRETNRQT